jgi:hypothetical protein
MGGARSSAKRRLRDTTTRAQKDYFSRQRLNANILFKRLNNRNCAGNQRNTHPVTNPAGPISLTHASYYDNTRDSAKDDTARGLIYFPKSHQSPRTDESQENRESSSKILQALDEIERKLSFIKRFEQTGSESNESRG